jgi:UDP-2,3-diacylglucosamine pyrophosphatase LpxH
MLALISDIHLSDGTAAEGNVAPEVFALALHEIYEVAAEVARARDLPTHVDLVLLGDIIDLLRTERWIEDAHGAPVPLSERPWGSARAASDGTLSPAVARRARDILAEILTVNAESLATIRGERFPPPPGVTVRRIYIPGNHDRLFLLDEALRAGVLGGLGAVSGEALAGEGIHAHRLEMPEYGTIARHGHEWDVWNNPSFGPGVHVSEYTDADYLPTPVGDAVTVELAVALPYEIRRRLLDTRAFSEAQAARIHRKLQRIEDVRPLFASFHWAFHAVSCLSAELDPVQGRILRAALEDTVRALASRFQDLEFTSAWLDRHHRIFAIDATCLLRLVLCALSAPPPFPARWVARQVENVLVSRRPRTVTRKGAIREDLTRVGDKEMRFVVYGHTHHPEHVPLRGGPAIQDVYLNTGTYRPGVFRADDGEGFVGWQRIAYACISSAEEAVGETSAFGGKSAGPAFVAWSGALSAGSASRAGFSRIR